MSRIRISVNVVRVDVEGHQANRLEGRRVNCTKTQLVKQIERNQRPMGMSLVVLMLAVATFVPALDPIYGTPCSSTRLHKVRLMFNIYNQLQMLGQN